MPKAPYGSITWLKADLEFHSAIAGATRNSYMVQFVAFVAERIRESILAAGNRQNSAEMARMTLGEHEQILIAIEAGDSAQARHAMRTHLIGAAQRVGLSNEKGIALESPTGRGSKKTIPRRRKRPTSSQPVPARAKKR
jgi:DNA-binding FadR family transcriptional regulator